MKVMSLAIAITSGNVGGAFAIDAHTGQITTAATLDYETLSSYSLVVTVTDSSGYTGSAIVQVEVP